MDKNIELLKEFFTKTWNDAESKKIRISAKVDKMNAGHFTSEVIESTKDYIQEDFVMVEPKFMLQLNKMERNIIIEIMSELKMYNPFWYKDYIAIGGKYYRAILSLRKKGLLIETGNKSILIVNPWFIKRGDIKRVIAATNVLLETAKVVDKKLIKNLEVPKESRRNHFHGSLS